MINKILVLAAVIVFSVHPASAEEGSSEATVAPAAPPLITDRTTGMEFAQVPGGCFKMGDTFGDGSANEKPDHEVCLSAFSIAKTDVTVGQFQRFVEATYYRTDAEKGDGCVVFNDKDPDKPKKKPGASWRNPGLPLGIAQDERLPVVCVSWNDAQAFIAWMNTLGSLRFRLPTEAEWEYSARSGGKQERFAGLSDESLLYKYANFCDANCKASSRASDQDDAYDRSSPACYYLPNDLGLCDMSGNAQQWVADWYSEKYNSGKSENPAGPQTGVARVLRGGSWFSPPGSVRASARFSSPPDFRSDNIGFRLVSASQAPLPQQK